MDLPEAELVVAKEINSKGVFILNQPKILNALNLEMVENVFVTLEKWQNTKSMIIIKGSGDKAFCAGSDLKRLIDQNYVETNIKFFKLLYTTAYMIANLKMPWVSLIDGVIMGGGVGYSIYGKYRIATERTVFAMPEVKLGGVPDIGASYFFTRLQGYLGYYLGLTGSRLHGIDNLYAGTATHYCPSAKISDLEQALIDLEDVDDIELVLNDFCPKVNGEFSLAKHLDQIDRCFSASTVEGILKNLENDGSYWAKETIKLLELTSPTSLKLALRSMRLGSSSSIGECLQMDYRIVSYFMRNNTDFREGVTAVLVRKDNSPKWNPSKLEDVGEEDVLKFFKPSDDDDELPISVSLLQIGASI